MQGVRQHDVTKWLARGVAVVLLGIALAIMLVPYSPGSESCGNLLDGSTEGVCGFNSVGWWFVLGAFGLAALVLGLDAKRRKRPDG